MLKKYNINPTLDMATGEWSSEGEVWLDDSNEIKFDRAAQTEAKSAAGTAGDTAAGLRSTAAGIGKTLQPFYEQEMTAQHAFNPDQLNELMNFSAMGAGGANSTIEGEAKSQEARTRNTSGFSSALDQASRDKQRALSENALGVAAKDVEGAKMLNQEGAAGEGALYGEDTKAMLDAMGVQTGDIKAQIEAGQSGWFQNMTGFMKAAGELDGGVGAAAKGFKG